MNIYDDDDYDHETTGWFCTCPICTREAIERNKRNEEGSCRDEDKYTYNTIATYKTTYIAVEYDKILEETKRAYHLSISNPNKEVQDELSSWDTEYIENDYADIWIPKSQIKEINNQNIVMTDYIFKLTIGEIYKTNGWRG